MIEGKILRNKEFAKYQCKEYDDLFNDVFFSKRKLVILILGRMTISFFPFREEFYYNSS